MPTCAWFRELLIEARAGALPVVIEPAFHGLELFAFACVLEGSGRNAAVFGDQGI